MNSFIVKLFVLLTEVLSGLIIGLIFVGGLLLMIESVVAGLLVAIGGTIFFVAIFGFAAIFIEIHKDVRRLSQQTLGEEGIKANAANTYKTREGNSNFTESVDLDNFYKESQDTNSEKYQLYLVKKFKIERNDILNKYVVGDELFSDLDLAIVYAKSLDIASFEAAKLKNAEIVKEKNDQVFERGPMGPGGTYEFVEYVNGKVNITGPAGINKEFKSMEEARLYFKS